MVGVQDAWWDPKTHWWGASSHGWGPWRMGGMRGGRRAWVRARDTWVRAGMHVRGLGCELIGRWHVTGPWMWGMWGREKARVLGRMCVLVMGPCQHVHGVVVASNGPHHPCDAHDVSLVVLLLLRAGFFFFHFIVHWSKPYVGLYILGYYLLGAPAPPQLKDSPHTSDNPLSLAARLPCNHFGSSYWQSSRRALFDL